MLLLGALPGCNAPKPAEPPAVIGADTEAGASLNADTPAQGDTPAGSDAPDTTPEELPEEGTHAPQAQQPGGADVESRSETHEYHAQDGTLLVRAEATYPQLSGGSAAAQAINDYYKTAVERHFLNAEQFLAPMAEDARDAVPGEVRLPYTAAYQYEVMANNGRILSIMHENYTFSGGMHEMPSFSSETFDLQNGGLLTLADLFTVPEETYLTLLFDAAAAKISETPEEYFDVTPQLLQEAFDPADFYMTDTGLTFYYQVYAIAPYTTGLAYFTIPLDDIRDVLDPAYIS